MPVNNRRLFRPAIFSRHPSHGVLRRRYKNLPLFPHRTLIRFGSTTETPEYIVAPFVEINTVESIKTSANKLKMKEAFDTVNVRTAPWFTVQNRAELFATAKMITRDWTGKLVCKAIYGSRGRGNTLISSEQELIDWYNVHPNLQSYIFEEYKAYALEYRLHVTSEGYFYTCRKALRQDVPEDQKWRRHDDICVWLLEENENFKKPNSWDNIVSDCVLALGAIGADVLSFDVRVQGPMVNGAPREYQDYILLECNSASSMGKPDGDVNDLSICAQKYIEELPKIIEKKWRQM